MAGHRRRSNKKLLGWAARGGSTRSDPLGAAQKPRPTPGASSRACGIANEQAAELARLQRALGVPYTGRGMTAAEAARAIASARAMLGGGAR